MGLHECGMLADKEHDWMACSPGSVALVDLQNTAFADSIPDDQSVQISCTEIKTSTVASSLSRALKNATFDLVCTKIIRKTLKTLVVNAFFAWKFLEKKELVHDGDRFQNLCSFRTALNNVEYLADCCVDASVELLRYADYMAQREVEAPNHGEGNDTLIQVEETSKLQALARDRQRNRVSFFNNGDGIKLRLNLSGHCQKQMRKERWCALCGMNRMPRSGFRGHRSCFKFSQCDLHLCIRTHARFWRSFWDVRHSKKRLELRL